MALQVESWAGLVERTPPATPPPIITLPLQASTRGGSGTFLAADADGAKWWVKPLNNRQGGKVVVTEQVVSRVGALIGAPVCEAAVVEIPPELEGWEFRPGSALEAGYAHGSRAVDAALEERALSHGDRDDNGVRHAGVFALYDWCWGGDDQWLYAELDDRKLFSHDHGWYFPDSGNNWSVATLEAQADEPHPPRWPSGHLDGRELERLAAVLRLLPQEKLVEALMDIPETWPVSDAELEALGCFLEYRAPRVADRLDALRGLKP